jgi:hypothetical protein
VLSTKTILPVLVLASLPIACAARNSSSLASDTSGAEDVTGTESDVESLGSSFVGGDGQSVATQSLTAGSGDIRAMGGGSTTVGNPGFYFQPAGCLQVTTDKVKQTATYVFDACTGPLGLVELSGTIDVSWQVAAGKLTIDFASQGFKINRATIDSWQATAVVTASGNDREMTWNATLSGTTGRGRAFSRTNQKDLKWTVGVPCLAVSGQSTGNVLRANLQTTITSFQRCADSCPQAGSDINVKNLDNGDSIDIKYDGGPQAELTINGKSQTIGLACGD